VEAVAEEQLMLLALQELLIQVVVAVLPIELQEVLLLVAAQAAQVS
jgi:hypothetical protein